VAGHQASWMMVAWLESEWVRGRGDGRRFPVPRGKRSRGGEGPCIGARGGGMVHARVRLSASSEGGRGPRVGLAYKGEGAESEGWGVGGGWAWWVGWPSRVRVFYFLNRLFVKNINKYIFIYFKKYNKFTINILII
jgi:hypothetical protein